MKILPSFLRAGLLVMLVQLVAGPMVVSAADKDLSVPGIIQDGFKAWPGKNASYAFDVWKKGGVLEFDAKPAQLSRYFSQIDHTIGNYKSFEAVDSKTIGQSTRILYVAIEFEHAAVYGRFLLFRTDRGWVVQNMDFSPKPEAVMPWLAFTGEDYGQ